MRRGPAAFLVIAAALGAIACGKKGPPLPPLRERPAAVTGLRARQIGDRIVLSFDRPSRRITGAALGAFPRIEIGLTAESYGPGQEAGETVWSLEAAEWPRHARGGRLEVPLRVASLAEALGTPDPAALAGRPLGITVRVLEPGERPGELAVMQAVRPCSPPPPPDSADAVVVEEGIRITLDPGADRRAGARARIYRSERGEWPREEPIASLPLPESGPLAWVDAEAPFGVPFRYVVRIEASPGCESADGPALQVTRIDTFPPAPPEGLVAVAEQGAIRLFWRPGREADLRGYRVWRRSGPSGEMILLTQEDVLTTSYTDTAVEPGVSYTYAVTARDRTQPPNESSRSETATETAERDQ